MNAQEEADRRWPEIPSSRSAQDARERGLFVEGAAWQAAHTRPVLSREQIIESFLSTFTSSREHAARIADELLAQGDVPSHGSDVRDDA